ncbi:FAD-binding protein [Microbacterium sp. NPDC016588]
MQPGVIVADPLCAAAARGLFRASDPASTEWAAIGPTIATYAGGIRCIRYGVTWDAVLSRRERERKNVMSTSHQ